MVALKREVNKLQQHIPIYDNESFLKTYRQKILKKLLKKLRLLCNIISIKFSLEISIDRKNKASEMLNDFYIFMVFLRIYSHCITFCTNNLNSCL